MAVDLSVVGLKEGPHIHEYGWRDVALYALGLAAGVDDLPYLLDDPPPRVLPTYGVVPAFPPVHKSLQQTGGNLVTLLHSGQRTELVRPFPASGRAETTSEIKGIYDIKIGALVVIDTETTVGGELCARTSWQLLLRGEGGFGGERFRGLLRTKPPQDKAPDFSVEVPTRDTQALLYRLSGDTNPIHSHPEVARAAGFDRPILHGLCYYGIGARVALKELAGDDPSNFKAFEARFAKIAMPGDTLVVEGWKLEDAGTAAVTVTVKETGEKPIANGLFEYSA